MNDVTFTPLRDVREYEAARERLAEIEDEGAAELDDESGEEADLLYAMTEDFEAREGVEEDDDFELVSRLPDPEPEALAAFDLSNGGRIDILSNPHEADVIIVEMAPEGAEGLLLDDAVSPASLYLRLAARTAPVPNTLIRFDDEGILEMREVCETVQRPMEVELSTLFPAPAGAQAAQTGFCQSDPAGAIWFSQHHCGTGGGAGYGKSESYCYSGASAWIQKTSKSRRRATYSRMAACGSSTCRLRHFYKRIGGWHRQYLGDFTPKSIVGVSTYKRGIGRYRRVRFERLGNDAFVRGWVRYHSQAAEVWP